MVSENFREEAKAKGYTINSISYTKKEKKAKGNVIDSCYQLKVVKTFGGLWDGLDN